MKILPVMPEKGMTHEKGYLNHQLSSDYWSEGQDFACIYMCDVYMCKQSKVVFLFPLETWRVYTAKYKTDIGLREGQREGREIEKSKAI